MLTIDHEDAGELDGAGSPNRQQRSFAVAGFLEHLPIGAWKSTIDLHLCIDLSKLNGRFLGRVEFEKVSFGFFVAIIH